MKNLGIYLLIISVVFVACNKTNNTSNETATKITETDVARLPLIVDEPLPTVKPKPIVFTIDPSIAQELITEKGSKISIPKNAFVDKNGKPVKGKVDIVFEEFHHASDIILSGIPMNITTDEGEQASFESAGMFRLEGSQDGNEIMLANNKTLEVELASFKTGDDFNFYEFDEEEGSWVEKAQAVKEVVNETRVKALKELSPDPAQPVEIKKAETDDFVFDISVDQQNNPEFAHLEDVMWRLTESTEEDLAFNETIRSPKLECIDQSQSIFRLTGTSSSGTRINTKVQPVLFGRNWKRAQASFRAKLDNYKEAVEERRKERAKINAMAETSRNFSVSGFGVYNFDKLYKLRRKVQFNALFFIPALNKILKKAFLIQGKNKVAIPYTTASGYMFTFDPNAENTVITFDADGNLYEFTSADFEQLNQADIDGNGSYTFRMRETPYTVNSASDLEQYLASL